MKLSAINDVLNMMLREEPDASEALLHVWGADTMFQAVAGVCAIKFQHVSCISQNAQSSDSACAAYQLFLGEETPTQIAAHVMRAGPGMRAFVCYYGECKFQGTGLKPTGQPSVVHRNPKTLCVHQSLYGTTGRAYRTTKRLQKYTMQNPAPDLRLSESLISAVATGQEAAATIESQRKSEQRKNDAEMKVKAKEELIASRIKTKEKNASFKDMTKQFKRMGALTSTMTELT